MTAARVWTAIEKLTRCFGDRTSLQDVRLKKIEDRLSALDGGEDAQAAARSALYAVNVDRIAGGRDMLALKITDDARIESAGGQSRG